MPSTGAPLLPIHQHRQLTGPVSARALPDVGFGAVLAWPPDAAILCAVGTADQASENPREKFGERPHCPSRGRISAQDQALRLPPGRYGGHDRPATCRLAIAVRQAGWYAGRRVGDSGRIDLRGQWPHAPAPHRSRCRFPAAPPSPPPPVSQCKKARSLVRLRARFGPPPRGQRAARGTGAINAAATGRSAATGSPERASRSRPDQGSGPWRARWFRPNSRCPGSANGRRTGWSKRW